MRWSVSDTAEYGDYVPRPARDRRARSRRTCSKILADIQDGEFAREWMAEDDAGRPNSRSAARGRGAPDRGDRPRSCAADELGRPADDDDRRGLLGGPADALPGARQGRRVRELPRSSRRTEMTASTGRCEGLTPHSATRRRPAPHRGVVRQRTRRPWPGSAQGAARRPASRPTMTTPTWTNDPVVLIAEELAPAAIEVLAHDFEVRHVDGADRAALLSALADADAVIVRSATKIDAEAIAAAPRLKVVARAGVGLDNVDVPAATARRRHGRQRAHLEHRLRRRAGRRAAARGGPQHRQRQRRAQGRRVEAVQVHRRRDPRARPSASSASAASACCSPSASPRSAPG